MISAWAGAYVATMRNLATSELSQVIEQGFSAPDASWFKGESIEYVKRKLFSNSARIYDLVDQKTVRSLVDDHLAGRENRRLLIWSLLNLEQIMESYF